MTYQEAAAVQPFANTLVNMRMTGAQIKTVLEQQWQRDGAGKVPSRPFLRLGTSKGFEFTYDPQRPEGDRITGMYLNDQALDPAGSYSVTANSFLASGGDNFRGFAAPPTSVTPASSTCSRWSTTWLPSPPTHRSRPATPSTPLASTCPTATPSLAVAP